MRLTGLVHTMDMRWILILGLCCSLDSRASETTSFSYDALGRLTQMGVTGGARSGVQQGFGYDSAGNRIQVASVGPTNAHATTLTAVSSAVNVMGTTGALTVNVGTTSVTGSVSFYVDGLFAGTAQVANGQGRILLQGFDHGVHTVRATYSGDASNDPATTTFVVTIRNLSWLPAVLDSLLSN